MNIITYQNIKSFLNLNYIISAIWFISTAFFSFLPFCLYNNISLFLFFILLIFCSILFVFILYRFKYSKLTFLIFFITFVFITLSFYSNKNAFDYWKWWEVLLIWSFLVIYILALFLFVYLTWVLIRKVINPKDYPSRLKWLFVIPITIIIILLNNYYSNQHLTKEKCEKISNIIKWANCYNNLAYQKNDSSLCTSLDNKHWNWIYVWAFERCLDSLIIKKIPIDCKKFSNLTQQKKCNWIVSGNKDKMPRNLEVGEKCEKLDLDSKLLCYKQVAKETSDLTWCFIDSNEDSKKSCFGNSPPRLCEILSDIVQKQECCAVIKTCPVHKSFGSGVILNLK